MDEFDIAITLFAGLWFTLTYKQAARATREHEKRWTGKGTPEIVLRAVFLLIGIVSLIIGIYGLVSLYLLN